MKSFVDSSSTILQSKKFWLTLSAFVIISCVAILILMFWWSREPKPLDVTQGIGAEPVIGEYVTKVTIVQLRWLLDKPGGFTVNDVLPPGIMMDNIPEFEYGVMAEIRDWTLSMRDDFSRSQTQSKEDENMVNAQTLLNNDIDSWMFPAMEDKLEETIVQYEKYLSRLRDTDSYDGQFYARADVLAEWLERVNKRLGGISDSLASSVGTYRRNTDFAGDASAMPSGVSPTEMRVKTSWREVDDVFFYSRGYTHSLLARLEAVKIDFASVLKDKNADASLDQIIRELKSTQTRLNTPIIPWWTNGYGMMNNVSKTLSSDVSRANSALIDLAKLLRQG